MTYSIQGCYNGNYMDEPIWWLLDGVTADSLLDSNPGEFVRIAKKYVAILDNDGDTFKVYRLATDL